MQRGKFALPYPGRIPTQDKRQSNHYPLAMKLKVKSVFLKGIPNCSVSVFFAFTFSFLMFAIQVRAGERTDSLQKQNQFQVGLGADYIKTIDFLFSPNMYKSVRTNLRLGYSKTTKQGIFSSDLNLFMGNLKHSSGAALRVYLKETDIEGLDSVKLKELQVTQIGFGVKIGYLHELPKWRTARTAIFLGGSLEEHLTYTPGLISIGVINAASVHARARFDYILRNGKPLSFTLTFPAVSLITRLPYHESPGMPGKSGLAAFFTGNNKIETLDHFQNVHFAVKYQWLVKKHVAFNLKYQASWMHYYQPEHLTQAGSQLSLGLTF